MLELMIAMMIYLGAVLMVYNIYGFIMYARQVKSLKGWNGKDVTLYIPIVLLVFFLIGYVVVGTFGDPDLVMAGILLGGSIFVFVIYRFINDITDNIINTEKMESKLEAAEEASSTKTNFLANMSHEMRTPMNVILGMDELALRDPEIKPETRDSLEKIGQSGRHLLELINDILEMNDIYSDELVIKKEKFSLDKTVSQVNVIAETLCEKKGLTYRCELSEDASGYYIGDDLQIRQSLIKVLDNAVKFTETGSVELDISAEDGNGGMKNITFRVSDTGIGIDETFLPKVFDVFTQQDTSSTKKYRGSGLSLAVTKKVVEIMGGSIKAESDGNSGSVFTIVLPLEKSGQIPEEEGHSPEEIDLAGKRALVVEDIEENAEIVMDLLELEGMESEHAENGKIALDMFEHAPAGYYDVVLMDLRMPVMDGLESSRRIRALERPDAKKIPIIALTANAFDSDVKATMDAGMNAHLAKPADSDKLYYTIRQQIALAMETD